jgi:3-deoxy-D-manno-octulosonate 8-phosphate phosphatase (KDO 8-P phosphatase)
MDSINDSSTTTPPAPIPKYFILDVDGVMTTGQFLYGENGKAYKVFGPHDADGLKLLKSHLDVGFITADKRGYSITKKRIVDDMGFRCDIVSEAERHAYIERLGFENVIFMGDGIHDARIMRFCAFSIAPKNARKEAIRAAHFITESNSAEGAVLDASLEILRRYFPEIYERVC